MRECKVGNYTCFLCPGPNETERHLSELCPTCEREYGFPIFEAPESIATYKIVRPLSRGFYAATYVAERGPFRAKSVLKVSPKCVYTVFGKKFTSECEVHSRVALGTEHIVKIRDMFDATVEFGRTHIACHVAELDYIDGRLLSSCIDSPEPLAASTATQIAIDLIRILAELQAKRVHHNDLHEDNIIVEELPQDARRADAIDEQVRAVAIDLGSISDESKSHRDTDRRGDLRWISVHLERLWRRLLRDPDEISDLSNRMANALLLISQSISPDAENQRTPTAVDLIEEIKTAYYRQPQHWRPWREAPALRAYSASYNAQTMQPWHVPYLLVDPDDQWRNAISAPGPQVITGMRGCGKTMLLRALQFHARGTQLETETKQEVLSRISSDDYIGLFVSAQRLLGSVGTGQPSAENWLSRLFVAYALEAVRAIEHLRDIDGGLVTQQSHRPIAQIVAGHLQGAEEVTRVTSDHALERRLCELFLDVARARRHYSLVGHPSMVFSRLGEGVRECARVWDNSQVLFLLDDVSTRYLSATRIRELLSSLLFQDPLCAFKISSETQTIYRDLWSPGENHPARIDRDVKVFDLGAEVYDRVQRAGSGNGKGFLADILRQRAGRFPAHPAQRPEQLLGNVPLETIAKDIAEAAPNSRKRKEVYRGIAALAGMCVGDIGDVISLYEQMLARWKENAVPIAAAVQSECFQDLCARRLYDLNRRQGELMDVAKAFSEASYTLLVRSADGAKESETGGRIRQYSAVYVRVTAGDKAKQTARLRELVDAGVFVFGGGSNVPRTKTRDGNPTQQFKLMYRKVYGIVNFVGLADRDRFELSGADLEEWIEEPKNGREILLRNQIAEDGEWEKGVAQNGDEAQEQTDELGRTDDVRSGGGRRQGLLFTKEEVVRPSAMREAGRGFLRARKPVLRSWGGELPKGEEIEWIVAGLGFEERTSESIRRLCSGLRPKKALMVRYAEVGRSDEIRRALADCVESVEEVEYEKARDGALPDLSGNVMVDVTGLAKPVIFRTIRNELRHKGRVLVCHTAAQTYYPRDADVERVLRALEEEGRRAFLAALHAVVTGERGPYKMHGLLEGDADESRQRVLFAFASAKHERLLSLLDSRDYDLLEVVVPAGEAPRDRLALLVAEMAARDYSTSNSERVGSDDVDGVLKILATKYRALYVDDRLNFEIGLTGSKLQAVACAAASAVFRFSQCWYLQPREFDASRFTTGVGQTRYYEIRLDKKDA